MSSGNFSRRTVLSGGIGAVIATAGVAIPGRFALSSNEHHLHVMASPSASPAASPQASPIAIAAQRVVVHIDRFVFVPREIEINTGTRVIWSNDDGAAHTVTADDGEFDSGQMTFSEKFGHTFTQPGIYTYYCAFHANMTGVVTVIGDSVTEGAIATLEEATPAGTAVSSTPSRIH